MLLQHRPARAGIVGSAKKSGEKRREFAQRVFSLTVTSSDPTSTAEVVLADERTGEAIGEVTADLHHSGVVWVGGDANDVN